jgi:hypothetical protein
MMDMLDFKIDRKRKQMFENLKEKGIENEKTR